MPKSLWLASYPPEVPTAVNLSDETLIDVLLQNVKEFPHHTALYFLRKKISYKKLWKMIVRFAAALQTQGLKRGERVAICLPNCPEFVIAFFGIIMAGGVVVPCNPLYTKRELEYQLSNAGAKFAVVWDEAYERLAAYPLEGIFIARITDFMPFYVRIIYRKKIKKIPATIPFSNTVCSFYHIVSKKVSAITTPELSPNDTAVLPYTGGTTGISKGVKLTHRNIIADMEMLAVWFYNLEKGAEKFLAALPLFHAFGMTVTQCLCLSLGGCMILIPDPRKLEMIIDAVRKQKATGVCLVPKLFELLADKLNQADCRNVKFFVSGAAPLKFSVYKKFWEKTGCPIIQGYGLSEAGPVTHVNRADGITVKNSIGLPLPNTQAIITDESGDEATIGTVGELRIKGPQVMNGYWHNDEESRKVITGDGWLCTGDMAYMDEDGFFYISDRKKDIIVLPSGFKIFPSEVEKVLEQHPKVKTAAVVGIPDKSGDAPKAFIVLKENVTETSEELIRHCKMFLAPYKIPHKYEFRESLPQNIIGKMLHRVLRDEEIAKSQKISPLN